MIEQINNDKLYPKIIKLKAELESGKCICGFRFDTVSVMNPSKFLDWYQDNAARLSEINLRYNQDKLMLPRLDIRINTLAEQIRKLERKYYNPHDRVAISDLINFGIKYPIEDYLSSLRFRSPRVSPTRDLDGEPCNDDEFVKISHGYEPKLFDVRFYLERELDIAINKFQSVDLCNYFQKYNAEIRAVLIPSFPIHHHFGCIINYLEQKNP